MRMWIVKRSTLIRWAIILALVIVLIVLLVVACSDKDKTPSGADAMQQDYEVETLASATKERPIYSVGIEDKRIAISFDAAFDDDRTDKILEILESENVTATFFLCGFWIDKYPQHVKEIMAKGHELGNHTNTHPHMTKISADKVVQELKIVDDKLAALTGKHHPMFRAPYGEYNDTVVRTARDAGYICMQWSIDTVDWKPQRSADTIVNVSMKKLAPGAIILCHNNGSRIEEYLPRLIKEIKAQGYTFVPISELLHTGVTKIDANGVQWPAS